MASGEKSQVAFNAKGYKAAENSPLAAATNGLSTRVYFQKAGSSDLTVAYTEDYSTWNEKVARSASEGF